MPVNIVNKYTTPEIKLLALAVETKGISKTLRHHFCIASMRPINYNASFVTRGTMKRNKAHKPVVKLMKR